MKKFYLIMLAILGFAMQANASVKLKALSGSNWGAGEGPAKLVDEQTNSKWGTWDGRDGNPVYIIMKASEAIAPKGYELISANDTYRNTGRSWKNWKIYAGNFSSDADATINATGWVLIDSKEDQSLNKGKEGEPYAVNKLNVSETIASGTYYTYFKIVVEALEGTWNDNYCQMDGFRFTNVKFKPQDVTFTYTNGNGNNGNSAEGMDKLFDLDCNTKYCGDAGCYALVTASEPVFVWGYDLTTANDNNGGRKVTKWSLYGTNDETVAANPNAEGWVTLSNIDQNSYIEGKNWYTQRFFCNKGTAGTAYKYFKVTLDAGGFIQLSEFRLRYDTYRVMAYNWKAGPDASVAAFDGLPNPKWEGGNGDFVGKSFTIETVDGNSYAVKKYHFTTNDDGAWQNRAPKSWKIEGSDDNSNWTTIAEVDDYEAIHNVSWSTYEFTPSNTTDKFRYVRLTLNAMKGTGWSQIGDFQVLAVSDVSDRDYYTDLVNTAKASPYDRGSLSETDIWYVEYKNLYDGLDALLAACISSGNYTPIVTSLEKMETLVPLMDKLKVTTTDYVAINGSSTWGDGHWSQLLDGKDGRDGRESTKWGGNFSGAVGSAGHVQYVIFRRIEALQPYFYRLVTGGDTKTQTTRNWRSWKVYGANFTTISDAVYDPTKWTVLDSRENISKDYLPMENCYPAAFNFTEGVNQPYYYYMVAVTESYGKDKDDGTHEDGTQQQMNEMYLCTQAEFEAIRQPLVDDLASFDTTRPIEEDMADELADFNTKFALLQTIDDAVQLTLLYNQCVALRAQLEASMNFVEFDTNVPKTDGVYQISTAGQLVLFSTVVNSGRNNLNAALAADIELTSTEMPAPIGNLDHPYTGSFNGQGKAVKNFAYSNASANNVGFFGIIAGATIEKLMLKNASVIGGANAGGLVGNAQNASTIKNCAVVDTYVEGRDHVAAIAANAIGGTVISNNYSNATVKSRQYQAGGMVGTIYSVTIEKNLFTGTVTCENNGDASGLVSRIDGIASPQPIIRNNMVAASTITGGTTFSLVRADWSDRPVTFADNYILKSTVYSTGEKNLENKNDANGKQVTYRDATCKSFYADSLEWDLTNDWKFFAAGYFPVLAWMPVTVPVQAVTVTDAGYATIVAQGELTFDGSVQAFTAQVLDDKYVVLNPITSVPVGEAIVIKATAGTYDIPYALENAAAVVDNDLKASTEAVVADGAQYILYKPEGQPVGFYKAATGSTIAAGKGYIELAGASGVKALLFEGDDATAIETIATQTTDGAIYNLAGQRLQKMQKGINIINNIKILK